MSDTVQLHTEGAVFTISERNAGMLTDTGWAGPHPTEAGALAWTYPRNRTVVLGLEIDNTYELYEEEHTSFTNLVLPAPDEDDVEDLDGWADDHIRPFTGIGHEDGDSWYDVLVSASSDPELVPVGTKFNFGY